MVVRSIQIVFLTIPAAVVYGVCHDEVTARVCVEYFTIGHLPVFGTDDPTLLGLGWSVIATWWVGLILGVPLAAAAQAGRWRKMGQSGLLRPLAATLLAVGAVAALAGLVGHAAAVRGWVYLVGPIADRRPRLGRPARGVPDRPVDAPRQLHWPWHRWNRPVPVGARPSQECRTPTLGVIRHAR